MQSNTILWIIRKHCTEIVLWVTLFKVCASSWAAGCATRYCFTMFSARQELGWESSNVDIRLMTKTWQNWRKKYSYFANRLSRSTPQTVYDKPFWREQHWKRTRRCSRFSTEP